MMAITLRASCVKYLSLEKYFEIFLTIRQPIYGKTFTVTIKCDGRNADIFSCTCIMTSITSGYFYSRGRRSRTILHRKPKTCKLDRHWSERRETEKEWS